jgi:hypothetical protein
MEFAQINQEIKQAALADTTSFLNTFLDHEKEVVDELQDYSGLQTELYLNQPGNEMEQVKFGAIFSDFLSLYTGAHHMHDSHITYFDKESKYSRDLKITIPRTLTGEIGPNAHLLACYAHSNSEDMRTAATRYSPLIDVNKAMLRPVRSLWVDTNHIVNEKKGVIYYVHGNTDPSHWTIKDSFLRDALPIDSYLSGPEAQTMFDLTIPYFKNTDLSNLSKVLVEETDSLGSFRKELKKIVLDLDASSTSLKEIQQDVLRPQLEQINRKFQHHKNVHSLKVLGGVGMFTLSLVKIVVPQSLVSEFVGSILGSSGLSTIFISELKYQSEINKLRDNPYFLLWKINKKKK